MARFRYIVQDVDAAVTFYASVLGFDLVQQYGPAMAILRKGDGDLWLAGPMSSAAKPMPSGAKPASGGWNRIVVLVDDIDASVRRLTEMNVAFRNDVTEGPGGKQILCEDPSGNPVELFEVTRS